MMTDEQQLSGEAFAPDDAAGLSDAELRALLAQAKLTNDEPLRHLIASYLVLRRLSAEMITLIEAREGAQTVTRSSLFSRLKHVTRRRAT